MQLASGDFQAPLAIDFEDQATAEIYRLLDTPAFDGKQVLFGPSHELTGTWLFRHRVAFPSIPPGLSSAAFMAWLEQTGIDYILANAANGQASSTQCWRISGLFAKRRCAGTTVGAEMGGSLSCAAPTKFVLIRVR